MKESSSMRVLRLSALVTVVVAVCCGAELLTMNPDTPEHFLLANIIVEHLEDYVKTNLKATIDQLKVTVEELCEKDHADTPVPLPPSLPYPDIANLSTKLQTMEGTLNEAIRRMNAIEEKLEEKTENLTTSSDMEGLVNVVRLILDDIKQFVQYHTNNTVTREQVTVVMREQVEGVKEAVRKVHETCGSNVRVTELIQNVQEVNEHVEQVKVVAQVTRSKVEQCAGQNITQEVMGVGVKVQEAVRKVEGLRDALEEELQDIAGKVEDISNTSHLLAAALPSPLPSATTTLEEEKEETAITQKAHVYPCLDSTFTGTKSATICHLAIRFRKCYLNLVSYHCCHTCTSAGQLPEMGPWRHLLLPRNVTTLQVIRIFAP